MKKIFIILIVFLGFTVSSFAQVEKYVACEYTMRIEDNWYPWEPNDCVIEFDYDNNIVKIYSYVQQTYKILNAAETPPDNNGVQTAFNCINEKGEKCRLRLRIQKNGIRQIYIDEWKYDITTVYTLQKSK